MRLHLARRIENTVLTEELADPASPFAKVCNAWSCKNAQWSRKVNTSHRRNDVRRISWDTPLIRMLSWVSVARNMVYTSRREVWELQTSAHGKALSKPVSLISSNHLAFSVTFNPTIPEMAYHSVVSQLGRRNDTQQSWRSSLRPNLSLTMAGIQEHYDFPQCIVVN